MLVENNWCRCKNQGGGDGLGWLNIMDYSNDDYDYDDDD